MSTELISTRTTSPSLQIGLQHHRAGRLPEAEACYHEILQFEPEHPDALHLLGLIAQQAGQYQIAVQLIQAAIQHNPRFADYHYNLGNTYLLQGNLPAAAASYRRTTTLDPGHAEAHYNLGIVLKDQSEFAPAAEAFRRALLAKPDYPEALNNLGTMLQELDDFSAAGDALRRAIALKPDLAEAHSNLGGNFWLQGDLAGAVDSCRHAVALKPELADAHCHLGHVLYDQGDLGAALECYQRAATLKPDSGEFLYYAGLVHLLRGDFSAGWQDYEYRWHTRTLCKAQRKFAQPLWHGEPLNGARILLHAEQGLGDAIQFVRYAPLVTARGGRVTLEVQPQLRRLIAGMQGEAQVLSHGDPLPNFRWQCPLMSLPLAFKTELATVPASVPYLRADVAERETWSPRLQGSGLRVGVAWAGNPGHSRDRTRSIPLVDLAPVIAVEGTRFYSLQKGEAATRIRELPSGLMVTDLDPELRDFADTAAVVANLDLVISVDTAVAHLAGALGKPVWVLLHHTPDWRWLLGREDSPWYPTARLFRQPAPGDWASVIVRVAAELAHLASPPSRTAPGADYPNFTLSG
jgi:tetratricopeptide (TPR) repeat protein